MSAGSMNQDKALAQLKKDVRSLLISAKMGLDAEQLGRDYIGMMGHPMPLKDLGFRNIMAMVTEMPDVVSIYLKADGSMVLKAVSDKSTKGIEELVAKQQKTKYEKRKQSGRYCPFIPRFHHVSPPAVPPRWGRAPPFLPAQLRMQLRTLLSQGPIRLSDLDLCFLRCYGHPLRVHSYGFYSTVEMLAAATDMVCVKQSRMGTVLILREHFLPRSLVRPLPQTQQSPRQQPITQTPPGRVYEGANVVVNRSEEVVKVQGAEEEPCEEERLFQERVIQLEEELCALMQEKGVAGTISQELKEKLQKVVGQTSGGLLLHDLPVEYKRMFGEELPLQQSGFVGVTELVEAMSDTLHLKPSGGEDGRQLIITDAQHRNNTQSGTNESCDGSVKALQTSHYFNCGQSPWEDGEDRDETNQVPEVCPVIQVHSSTTEPPDAMQCQRLKPPTRHRLRELAEVLVEHVVSPGHFYIRFSESKEARALEDMMMDMRRCYTSPEVLERYHLPKHFVQQGQVCCVSPKGMWFYRVVIHEVTSPTQVKVYFVDYGVLSIVQSKSLKFLKLCFSVLPTQAVPSSLAGIQPTTGSWSTEATAAFQSLCSDRTLVGIVDDYCGDVLQLYLCDTNTSKDVYVHTELLSQGHGATCSPAVSAALCVQFSLVSVYFGD
ncbi:tudor domain-containing protein 5, partial [Genypterus blacodes]|uniref:tudor domain-containing protein 5 n=1 Tax=Genypterus blacodes TaxID=154954 RepID=UPI003F76DD24